jgi:hypothetical protein
MDKQLPEYEAMLKEAQEREESRCLRCGVCCGSRDGDPCVNLSRDETGKYFCLDYEHRFALQKTVSGVVFSCVPMRMVIAHSNPPHPGCGYAPRPSI